MSELTNALQGLRAHEGVEHLLLLGRDGLLVHHSGENGVDAETVAALAPSVVSACTALGDAAEAGDFTTAVIEWEQGVGVLTVISAELLLAVLLRPSVGFAPLLREIRARRAELAELA